MKPLPRSVSRGPCAPWTPRSSTRTPASRAQFLDLVVSLNATWRVTAAWVGQHVGRRSTMIRALAAWDCGPLGYWIREQPEEPIMPGQVGPDSALGLVKSNSAEVWEKISDLAPDKEELMVADE